MKNAIKKENPIKNSKFELDGPVKSS